jgi:hypothetical protein
MLAEKVAAPDSEKRKSLKLAAATTLTTNGIPVTVSDPQMIMIRVSNLLKTPSQAFMSLILFDASS